MPETNNEEIKQLLEKNLEYNMAIYEMAKKTKRYILISQIMGVVRILVFAVPLILALIYLPPLIKNYMAPYQELLGNSGGIMDQLQGLKGTEQLQGLFK